MCDKIFSSRTAACLFTAALLLVISAGEAAAQRVMAGCQIFPSDNVWNRRIDSLPVSPHSDDYINSAGPQKHLELDGVFPINIVGPDQKMVSFKVDETEESDRGPFPIPENPQIEPPGDSHMLILQTGKCMLYEMFAVSRKGNEWHASSSAAFDLKSNRLRPANWTSTDAAGLPVLPGLLSYSEVQSGEIKHALRCTVPRTQNAYVWPARHKASRLNDPVYPPMGTRLRLKADFDISHYSKDMQVILTALKRYGLFIADNGRSFSISGTPEAWPMPVIDELVTIKGESLEAVDSSEMMVSSNSGQAREVSPRRESQSSKGEVQPSAGEAQLDFAPTISVDFSKGSLFSLTLNGDVQITGIRNATRGQQVVFHICQDSAGNHKFTWPTGVFGGMAIATAPGQCSTQAFVAASDGLFATGSGSTGR